MDNSNHDPFDWLRRSMKALLAALLPFSLLTLAAAFRFPDATETVYAQTIYPLVARAFAVANGWSFSLAEPLALLFVVVITHALIRIARRPRPTAMRTLFWGWSLLGVLASAFVATWGYNYARPRLAEREALPSVEVDVAAVLASGREAATLTEVLFHELPDARAPSALPLSFEELNIELDEAYTRLGMAGDPITFRPTPAKPLRSSELFSYLGISGIYVPFTGEPSVNILQPDISLPMVVAHEKAHQRGITDEGEANFAAFLVCSEPSSPTYLRYAAYHFATRYLLGAASRYADRSMMAEAWELLSDGPRQDVIAIQEFWAGYEGPAQDVAAEVNNLYLESLRVEGGIESYGTVVQMLVALDASGRFIRKRP